MFPFGGVIFEAHIFELKNILAVLVATFLGSECFPVDLATSLLTWGVVGKADVGLLEQAVDPSSCTTCSFSERLKCRDWRPFGHS